MSLSEMDFKQGILDLQNHFNQDFKPQKLMDIANEVKNRETVSLAEWESVVDNLKGFCDRLPTLEQVRSSIRYIRGSKKKRPVVDTPCDQCNRMGWVWWWPDGRDGRRMVVLCGCGNSPAWAMERSQQNEQSGAARIRERETRKGQAVRSDVPEAGNWTAPPWTVKQLCMKGIASIDQFERHDGARLHENYQMTRDRKWEELRELYKRTGEKFIPKSLLAYLKGEGPPPWESGKAVEIRDMERQLAEERAL